MPAAGALSLPTSRWSSLSADCFPGRSLLPYPLPTLFHGAPGQQLCQGAPASSPLCRRIPACNSFATAAPPAGNSATVPLPAALPDGSSLQRPCRQSSVPTVPCLQQLRHSASASNKPHPAVLCADGPLPATASPQRLCWQQTSSGGEEYSGLASNLAHLGRIC